MNPQVSPEYLSQINDVKVKVGNHFITNTHILPNQTILQVGDYNLICSPAIISMSEISLLMVLTENEQNLFGRYQKTIQALSLNFEATDSPEPLRYRIRVRVEKLEALPGRKNICMFHCSILSCPGGLANTLGLYIRGLEDKKEQYNAKANDFIDFSELSEKWLGFTGPPQFLGKDQSFPFKILKASTTQGEIEWTGPLPDEENTQGFFRFNTLDGTFTVPGKWEAGETIKAFFEFSTEYLSFLDDVQFRIQLKKKQDE
jgi:hypothetical protein